MARVYIAIGSNIDPELNVPAALGFLRQNGHIDAISTIYCTEPLGDPGSPPFYNGMIAFDTCWNPHELKFDVLRKIESALGRVRSEDKNAARAIDLDITVYEDRVINEPDLIVPDPEIETRAFLAVPLLELDPELVVPGSGRKLSDIVQSISGASMVPQEEFTAALRREVSSGY